MQVIIGAVLALLALLAPASAALAAASAASPIARPSVVGALHQPIFPRLPLAFERNVGQADAHVKFLSRGAGSAVFLTGSEALLSLKRGHGDKAVSVVHMRAVGANANAVVDAADQLPGKVNYFIGRDPKRWRTDIATFRRVTYRDVYRGVDLVYYGTGGQLEYDFVVRPGGDPSRIAVAFSGPTSTRLAANGDLLLGVNGGAITWRKPTVYQVGADGTRKPVAGGYALSADGLVRFAVGRHDASRPLVIDPVLSYATYIGGNAWENGNGIAADSAGCAYVTGYTASFNFPTTSGAGQTSYAGANDAFVTKLSADGASTLYSTYLGGTDQDDGQAIAVDSGGNAYVVGFTYSNDFPTTAGSFRTTNAGGADGFVTKIGPAGNSLTYSTYLGGANYDAALGIALDGTRNAYITGQTSSTNFPVGSAYQSTFGGGSADAFLTKLNTDGTAVAYSTYLGGGSFDIGLAIAVDQNNCPYVTGYTSSSNFATTKFTVQTAYGGGQDAFVTKFDASGQTIAYSTYLGGSNDDEGWGIAVDALGFAYVAGSTASNNFPSTPGAYRTSLTGLQNGFLARISDDGRFLNYSTFLGGGAADSISSLSLDAAGNLWVAGTTQSSNFPVSADAAQSTYGGGSSDAFVAEINPTFDRLLYSTFLGGGDVDTANAIAVDPYGSAYLVGVTKSSNYPTTTGAFQASFGGVADAFVCKVRASSPAPAITSISPNVVNAGCGSFTLTLNGSGFVPPSKVSVAGVTLATSFVNSNTLTATVSAALVASPGSPTVLVTSPAPGGGTSNPATLTVLAPPTAHLLWKNTSGAVAVWTVRADWSFASTPAYGPYGTWQATTIADAPDGTTRILWTDGSGAAAVWTLKSDGTFTSTAAFGPFTGWTPSAIAVGGDNKTRILWKHRSGAAAIWMLTPGGAFGSSTAAYGPYGAWSATGFTVGADNFIRLFWQGAGSCSYWTFDAANNPSLTTVAFGPYGSWQGTAISIGSDNDPRLLWANSGQSAVWTLDGSGYFVSSTPGYGPYGPWSASAFAVGSDNATRLLWSGGGAYAVWQLSGNAYSSSPAYGPFTGWGVAAITAP